MICCFLFFILSSISTNIISMDGIISDLGSRVKLFKKRIKKQIKKKIRDEMSIRNGENPVSYYGNNESIFEVFDNKNNENIHTETVHEQNQGEVTQEIDLYNIEIVNEQKKVHKLINIRSSILPYLSISQLLISNISEKKKNLSN